MDNKLQIFNFEDTQVRTILLDETPWFVGKDVATILGYARPQKAVQDHVEKDDKREDIVNLSQASQNGTRPQLTLLVNESGVYDLIFNSKLPTAKRFKRWVTSEVLPSIRKHGAYMTSEKIEEILSDPDTIIKLAQELKREREGRLIAEQRVNELTPKASYYDLILQNKTLMTITQIAKDYGMSGEAMNKKLHELKVIYKESNVWLLYSKYQDKGWTQSTSQLVNDGKKLVFHTKWTQKGRLGLYELLKQHEILPLIEREDEVQEA